MIDEFLNKGEIGRMLTTVAVCVIVMEASGELEAKAEMDIVDILL